MEISLKAIKGSVTAAKGFTAAGVHCGVRKNRTKPDLALIYSEKECNAAGIFTKNKVKGAPVTETIKNLQDGRAQVIVVNSGNANTCTPDGPEKAREMCRLAGAALGLPDSSVIVASTGVIGEILPIKPVAEGIKAAAAALSVKGGDDACTAIMTTDTRRKQRAYSFMLGGRECRMGAIAKGSGMIHPNMATMLCFITTDAAVTSEALKKALADVAEDTFNMVSVDGDTSTSDMVCILANGEAGNDPIDGTGPDYEIFVSVLRRICTETARSIAADGEGATRLLECTVKGAPDKGCAVKVAKSVICSSLFKAAMFAPDANWGRILCAVGYADAEFDASKITVELSSEKGSVTVCRNSMAAPFSEDEAAKILSAAEIKIDIGLDQGEASATAWGCDLTYDYVKINGSYRT